MSEIAKKHELTAKQSSTMLRIVAALGSVVVALFAFYQLPMTGWSHLLIFIAGIGFGCAWLSPTERKQN